MDLAHLVSAARMNAIVPSGPRAARLKPLLHFVLLGALLFAARPLLPLQRFTTEPIEVSAGEVERLRAEWRAEMRRPPSAVELAAMVRRHADEQRLLREALRLGLDRSDPVVRRRLVQNLRFVRAEPAGDEAALLDEALALGMATRDLVARRRLVQAMEERLAAGVSVSAQEARAYAAAHPQRYGGIARVSFEQVFVDGGKAGADARAAELAVQLAREPDAAPAGDAFLLGARFTARSQADLARSFGAEFARAALQAPVGGWTGPLRTPYGLHFLRVNSVERGGEVDLAAVQRQARYALLQERERETVQAQLETLRRRYPLRLEAPLLTMAGAG